MKIVAVAAPPLVREEADLGKLPLDLADVVELRLDLLPAAFDCCNAVIAAHPRPVIFTLRSRREGGAFEGTPEEAASRLDAAFRSGPGWVDAECDVIPIIAKSAARPGTRVLGSQHGTGAIDLPRQGVHAWKIARPVDDGASLAAALAEARALGASYVAGGNPPAFVVPYGVLGGARVVTAAAAEGAGIDAFVYGWPGDTPPGTDAHPSVRSLPTIRSLVDEGRLGEVSGRARIFGLVGTPPATSPSVRLHAAVFRSLGVDAVYLREAGLDAKAALALPYEGWSVTTPLKEAAAALCDRLDPLAARIGAVNTVVRAPDGALEGSNTDALAVSGLLEKRGRKIGRALILGGGGFARAAAAACAAAGLVVRMALGTRTRAAAQALGLEHAGDDVTPRENDVVVVNATPVGGTGELPEALRACVAEIPRAALVIDGPYREGPSPGAFAQAASARGLIVIDGPRLLLEQATGQSARFLRKSVDRPVLECALRRRGPLVLVGRRGAGKTVVGRAVARRLGLAFVDTDAEIAKEASRPAGRVLALEGEKAFRERERQAVARATARSNAVVAMGGGALEDPASADLVRRRASFVVRLEATETTAANRVAADRTTPRPSIGEGEALAARLVSRDRVHALLSHASVATDARVVDDLAAEIATRFLERVTPSAGTP